MRNLTKRSCFLACLVSAVFMVSGSLAAWEAPKTPKADKSAMGPQDVTKGHRLKETPKKVSKNRVRIAVELQPYKKFAVIERDGKRKVAFKPQKPFKQMLRAKIDQPNHFYLKGYHIETVPLSWDKKFNQYRSKINFYQTYGKVEEMIGSLIIKGSLSGKNGLYVLVGNSKKEFRNKTGQTILRASIGLPATQRPAVSKGVPKKKRAQAMPRKKANSKG